MDDMKNGIFKVDSDIVSEDEYKKTDYFTELAESFKIIIDLVLSKCEYICPNTGNCRSCRLINDKNCFNEKVIKSFSLYIEKYERIPYFLITEKIYSLDDEDYDIFSNRIVQICNYLNYKFNYTKDNEVRQLLKLFTKINDHINLASNQKNYKSIIIDIEKRKATDIVAAVEESIKEKIDLFNKEKLESFNQELEKKITKTKENLYSELISIVGIFVAISFVMFGGMTLLNNLFDYSGMKFIPVIEMLCLGALVGLIIVDSIYAFIIMIFYLTNKAKEIQEQKFLKALIKRINIGLIFVIIITGVMWFFDIKKY